MNIIFLRHPETMANVNRLIYGWTESPYSEKGAASVGRVVELLKDEKIDQIYSSPLKRAHDLALAVGGDHNLEVVTDDRLREMHFGAFENKTVEEAKAMYQGDDFNRFWYDFSNFDAPEGENMGQVRDRVVDFFNQELGLDQGAEDFETMMKEDPGKAVTLHDLEKKTVLIVAHSITIRSALSHMLDVPLDWVWHIDVKPASLIEIAYHGGFGILTGIKG